MSSSDGSPQQSTDEPTSSAPGGAGSETEPTPGRRQRRGGLSAIGELVVILVVAMVISAVLRAFVFQVYEIPSGSMENTLLVGDRVATIKVADFQRGDIVVFRDPANWLPDTTEQISPVRRGLEYIGLLPSSSTNHLIKRVIGLPGDVVSCCDAGGRIVVNGVALDESSYLYTRNGIQVAPSTLPFEVTVPAGRVFVMGDHRDSSGDSRLHLCDPAVDGMPTGMTAFVPITDIVGPAELMVAPLNRLGRLHRPAIFDGVPAAGPAPSAPSITVQGKPCP